MTGAVLTLLDGVDWQGAPVPGEHAHALLATLVLAAPRAVSVSELVGEVWHGDEPDHPDKALQVLGRTLPTMSWQNVLGMADAAVPGLLRQILDAYPHQRPVELRQEALALVARV